MSIIIKESIDRMKKKEFLEVTGNYLYFPHPPDAHKSDFENFIFRFNLGVT